MCSACGGDYEDPDVSNPQIEPFDWDLIDEADIADWLLRQDVEDLDEQNGSEREESGCVPLHDLGGEA